MWPRGPRRCKASAPPPLVGTPPPKKSKQELDTPTPPRAVELTDPSLTWVSVVWPRILQIHQDKMTMTEYLNKVIRTMGANEWIHAMDVAFPPEEHVVYMTGFETSGSKCVRLQQLAFHKDAGNNGLLIEEDAECLAQLILVNGFLTNADNIQGAEKLAIKGPEDAFVEAYSQIIHYQDGLAPAFSVFHVKGWKRSTVALVVATLLMETGTVNDLKQARPDVFRTFCTVHAVLEACLGTGDSIERHRAITMASTGTRRAPNVFNFLHQIRKLKITGGAGHINNLEKWNTKAGLMKAFHIGPQEALAASILSTRCPQEFCDRMERLTAHFGMVRGPLTHAALSSDVLGLGKGPTLMSSAWTNSLKNDEYCMHMLGVRIEGDWLRTVPSMRKSLNAEGVRAKQLLVATFNKARLTLQKLVPEELFEQEFPLLEEKFKDQLLDMDLEMAAEHQQDPWDLDELTDFKMVLRRHQAAIGAKLRVQHHEIALRAEAATLDLLCSQLAEDEEAIDLYLAQKKAAGKLWDVKVCQHKKERYTRGVKAAELLMDTRFSMVDVPESKFITREVYQARRRLEDVKLSGGSAPTPHVHVLFYVDLNIDHSGTTLGAFKAIADVLHQSEHNALLLQGLQQHSNLKFVHKVKAERGVEDALLKLNLNMEAEASLHFKVDKEHARDTRRLESRFRLVVSNEFESSPTWKNSALGRGNLGECSLIKCKDMVLPASKLKMPKGSAMRFGPNERAVQKGSVAMEFLLESIVPTLGLGEGSKLLLVQVQPGEFAEMAHATLNNILRVSTPYLAYHGIYLNKAAELDEAAAAPQQFTPYVLEGKPVVSKGELPMHKVFLARLLEEWWDLQPEAGPPALTRNIPGEVARPVLKMCTWTMNDAPSVADSTLDKFAPDSAAYHQWAATLDMFKKKFGVPSGAEIPSAISAGDHVSALPAIGPDFSVDPQPQDLDATSLDVVGVREEEAWQRAGLLVKALGRSPGQPTVAVDVEYQVWLTMNGGGNGGDCHSADTRAVWLRHW